VIVDLSDDFTTFRTADPAGLRRRIDATLSWADGLVAVNEAVAAKFPHPRPLVFGNATDYENFQRWDPDYALGDVLPKAAGRKIVGFVGGLQPERVDQGLLESLLNAVPTATFLFVGSSNDPLFVRRLQERPNVRFFPAVPYGQLPSVIRAFDVAIVPHVDNEFTRGNDLLKVRDYLACGVPVVTTRSSGVQRFCQALWIAEGVPEFLAYVKGLLEGSLPCDPGPGLEIARRESWSATIPRLAAWLRQIMLAERLAPPPLSRWR
jgi:glycosyltransferase involved in cell wall biosynthesis